MPLYTLQDLREAAARAGVKGDDNTLVLEYAKRTGDDPVRVAQFFGVGQDGGMASNRIGAGIDNYQANLYGLGGAVARSVGADGVAGFMDRRREANEFQANLSTQRARDLGAVDDWRQIGQSGNYVSDALNYAGGLAAQALPYMGEAVVGGMAARGLMSGARAALAGAKTAEEAVAAQRALALGQSAGAAVASYPSAVGDILSNQRDAGGENLGSAALGGIPYAALNAVGVEGLVARGLRPIAGAEGGIARRMAVQGGKAALSEGFSETGQEVANQYFGRMAVNPNETLFSDDAQARYLDSFIGGAVLGGMAGAPAGLRRPIDDTTNFDLTRRNEPQQAPAAQPEPTLSPEFNTDTEVGLGITQPINPYNVGGYVDRFQQGGNTEIGTGQAGLFDGEAPIDFAPGEAPQAVAPTTQAAPATQPTTAARDPRDIELRDTYGVMPNQYSRQLFDAIANEGLEPGSPQLERLINYAAEQYMTKRRYEKALEMLDASIIEARKTAATQTAQAPAAATPAPAPAVAQAPTVEAPAAPVVPAAAQPAPTAVVADAPLDNVTPTDLIVRRKQKRVVTPAAPAQAYVAPEEVQAPTEALDSAEGDGYANDAEAWDDFRPEEAPAYDQLPDVMKQAWGVARKQGKMSMDIAQQITDDVLADDTAAADDTMETIKQVFGERDASMLYDVLVGGMKPEEAANKYGLSRSAVQKLAGNGAQGRKERAKKIAAAQKQYGWTDEYVKSLTAQLGAAETEQPEVVFEESAPDRVSLEAENMKAVDQAPDAASSGFGTVESAGSSQGNWKDTAEGSSPAEMATAAAQSAFELSEKAREKMDLIRQAWASGRKEISGTHGKQSLADAVKDVRSLRSKVREELAKSEAILKKAEEAWKAATEPKAKKTTKAKKALPMDSGQKLWTKLEGMIPDIRSYEALTANEKGFLTELADRTNGNPIIAKEPSLQELLKSQDEFEDIDRSPSLRREVSRLKRQYEQEKISAEALAAQIGSVLEATKKPDTTADRVRGPDYIRQRLLEAKRNGDMSPEAVDMAEWFVKKNPALFNDLGISIRTKGEGDANTAGRYIPFERLIVLLKDANNKDTTVHEMLHHMERMMPAEVQRAIRQAWLTSLIKAGRAAKGNDVLSGFYKDLMAYHMDGNQTAMKRAMAALKAGVVPYEHYQHVNASEFWAVNATGIVTNRFAATASVSGRIRQWLRELVQKLKAVFGLKSDAPIIKALDSLMKGDGQFQSKKMLSQADSFNMFLGRQGLLNGELDPKDRRMAKMAEARLMEASGATGDEIWTSTGWEKNPDGKWRFEISDRPAKFKADFAGLPEKKSFDKNYKPLTVGDVLDHPELFKAYPALKDVTFVKEAPFMDFFKSYQGWFSPERNEIAITPYAQDPLSTLLHEVQHWVQQKEGFAPGGNAESTSLTNTKALGKLKTMLEEMRAIPGMQADFDWKMGSVLKSVQTLLDPVAGKDIIEAVKAVDEAKANAAEAEKTAEEARARDEQLYEDAKRAYAKQREELIAERDAANAVLYRTPIRDPKNAELKQRIEELHNRLMGLKYPSLFDFRENTNTAKARLEEAKNSLKAAESAEKDILRKHSISKSDVQYNLYKLISGEAEARNTQTRQNLSLLTRRRIKPENSSDVPYEYQVVASRGKSASMEFNDIQRLPQPAQQAVTTTQNLLKDWGNKAVDAAVFTNDLIDRAVKAGLSSAKTFRDLMVRQGVKARELERDVERVADLYALVPDKERGTGPSSVNQFIFDSTRTAKWGYGQYRDQAMGDRFDAFSPQAQKFIKAVFDHGDKVLAKKKATVLNFTASEYDALIAAARNDDDTKLVGKLENEKANTLKRFDTMFKVREGIPYAPIKRMGDYAVVAKSETYREAEKNGDDAELRKLEKDPDHYHVTFAESKGEARKLADQLVKQGHFGAGEEAVQFFERDKLANELYGGQSMLGALTKLRSKADAAANEGDQVAARMRRMITDLYLESLAESSARKSEMRRRGVAGEVDMLRSFTMQGKADAYFLASVEYNSQIQDSIQKMRLETRGANRDRKSELLNELSARYLQSLDVPSTPTLDKVSRLTSIWYLATSPAYYLQNLTQPWVMSLPAMAGRHAYGTVSSELFKAYGDLNGVMKSAKLLKQHFDLKQVPADVRDAIQELTNRGKVDIGMDSELGEFRVGEETWLGERMNRVDRGIRLAVQKVETVNRLTTAMAAYRLERSKGRTHEEAVDYADRILTETHGDYTRFNAPRAFNTRLGKIALQFRKFQLIQLSFYAKLIRDAFTDPKERGVALKTLALSLGQTAVLAGVKGLPGYAAIAWAMGALFGDDDEPFDLTAEIRKTFGDDDTANLILTGAPSLAGADLSGKLGAGSMLSILPFNDADLSTRKGVNETIGALLGGAAGSLVGRFAEGLAKLPDDYMKGLELLLPKGFADAIKAWRIASGGVTRSNGDVLLPPEEINAVSSMMQALGIPQVQQTARSEKQNYAYQMESNFKDRTTKVKNAYAKAVFEKDAQARAAAIEEWKNLQEARRRNGFKVQPMSELLKAPQDRAKRERNTANGVQFKPDSRGFVEGL